MVSLQLPVLLFFYICLYPRQLLADETKVSLTLQDARGDFRKLPYSVFHVHFRPNMMVLHSALNCRPATRTGGKQTKRPTMTMVQLLTFLLMVAGDVECNPGPALPKRKPVYKFPCGVCEKPVKCNQKGIQCDEINCQKWHHTKCIDMNDVSYRQFQTNEDLTWLCNLCETPFTFSDSFFDDMSVTSIEPDSTSPCNDNATQPDCNEPDSESTRNDDADQPVFNEDFLKLRRRYPRNFIVTHINVNSLQHKFEELCTILKNNLVDCLFVSESKLNTSHPNAQFEIENYRTYRRDNIHDNGGGLICFVRSDLPTYEEKFDSHPCESLTIIVQFQKSKWAFSAAYRKPSLPERHLSTSLDIVIEKCMDITNNIAIVGDLNCNMLREGSNAVKSLCDDFNLTNVIETPTCFKTTPPTLLDVFLVSNKKNVKHSTVTPCPLSDFHHFVTAVFDIMVPRREKRQVIYRSFKFFDKDLFNRDLQRTPFQAAECLDPDDQCYFIGQLYKQVLDEHAPMKTKTVRPKQCVYMNSTWKKAIFKKHQLYNRYWKIKTPQNWHAYRKQRNLCQKLKRTSLRNYIHEKCVNSKSDPRNFWKTVSPYLSDKCKASEGIQLIENETLISDPKQVAELFNDKFSTIANDIGTDSVYSDSLTNHPSFKIITEHVTKLNIDQFCFKQTSVCEIEKILDHMNAKKATGYDGIPSGALKYSSAVMAPVLCNAINNMYDQCIFPQSLKRAEVTPIFKAKSRLAWANFRPVSILASLSKVFETSMIRQMSPHLFSVYSKYLSAYRPGMGCHTVLLHATEMWKNALDNKKYVGVIMTDLSKAFDCLPHALLVEKFKYYRFTQNATALINNYLSDRAQRVKVSGAKSEWATLTKGVPQGSVVGPQCFNLYVNDLLLQLVKNDVMPCNYADDTSVYVMGNTKDEVIHKLRNALKLLVSWFKDNLMKLNVDKFQFLMFCPDRADKGRKFAIQVDNVTLNSLEGARLLGVFLDLDLSFDTHIKQKCIKANSKLNALKRLSTYLTEDCKLAILRSFIIVHFLYCAALLHFSSKYFREKMEKIMYRGLKFVYNDHSASYPELLERAGMCSLELMREKTVIIDIHNFMNENGPEYINELYTIHRKESRRGSTLQQPRPRTVKYGSHSLRTLGPRLWNNLDKDIKDSRSLNILKKKLNSYKGNPCRCAQCK